MANKDIRIDIKRIFSGNEYTIGWLYLNGHTVCDTLEDTVRNLPAQCPDTSKWQNCKCKEKIYAETAIPAGKYKARVSYSPRFKRYLVEIMNVPHFLGIRIHGGNHKDHTEGCILVGEYTRDGMLINSQKTLTKLHEEIMKASGTNKFDESCGNIIINIE